PNPYNSKMISRISLDPAVVDCIVFWSKNPAPMLEKLDKLKEYNSLLSQLKQYTTDDEGNPISAYDNPEEF
ncbi:DUF1848 domain-containing protein, partial [Coprococcus eutactus]|nr:DUF1848 domain-containing protein [Coprococcus eutactus]